MDDPRRPDHQPGRDRAGQHGPEHRPEDDRGARSQGGLGASQSQLEWAINSYTLVFAGLLFTFGVIGDRIGRKRMLMIGMTMFGLASLLSSYAQTPTQLILARALMGLGGAAVMPQTLSIITTVFDPKERPRAIGIWAGAVGLAIAAGPIAGGLLLDHFWWGSVFLINVPLTAVGVIAIAFLVPESKSIVPGKIDYLGVLLSIAGLVLVVFGIIQGGDTGSWLRLDVLGPVFGGLAVLAAFGWYESRIEHPSLDVRLFRDPRLSSAAGAIALVFFALAGAFFFTSFYLQNVRGYSPLHAGLLTIPLAAGQLLCAPRSAVMVRRFGAKIVCASGLLLVAVAMIGYHLLGTDTPIWVLEVTFFIQGAGMGIVMPPATELVMSVVPAGPRRRRVRDQEHLPAGRGRARRRRARLGPGPGLPRPARPAPRRAAGRGRNSAFASIAATQAAAQQLGPAGRSLLTAANQSFVHAMHLTSVISFIIAVLGAVVLAIWMPGRRPRAQAAQPAGAVPAGAVPAGALPWPACPVRPAPVGR